MDVAIFPQGTGVFVHMQSICVKYPGNKNMNRRQFVGAGMAAATGLLGMPYSVAQIVNMNDAINKSGRQRMLSQRLAKSYLQIGQAVDLDWSRKILDHSLALFDRQLVELKAFAPTPENKAVLQDLSGAWLSYKDALVGRAPNQQDTKSILVINEEVLAMAQAATVQLEKLSGTATGRLVNIAGRQRMLSQRMAKFYQAMSWGVATPESKGQLFGARKEFIAALAELAASPKNTSHITQELQLAQQQWIFFDNALNAGAAGGNKAQQATNVATTSERILEAMDRITGMYEKLG
jgi:uncharacterized protein YecT (DUF1311 family)